MNYLRVLLLILGTLSVAVGGHAEVVTFKSIDSIKLETSGLDQLFVALEGDTPDHPRPSFDGVLFVFVGASVGMDAPRIIFNRCLSYAQKVQAKPKKWDLVIESDLLFGPPLLALGFIVSGDNPDFSCTLVAE